MAAIFINYRSDDSKGSAGRLYDHLINHFGKPAVFRDKVGIRSGKNFDRVIETQLDTCRVFLAVIGQRWLTVTDANGQRRLDNAKDWVRREIAKALQRGITVIPTLVDGASTPVTDSLPDDIKALFDNQTCELDDRRWEYDIEELIRSIREELNTPASQKMEVTAPTAKPIARRQSTSQSRTESLDRQRTAITKLPNISPDHFPSQLDKLGFKFRTAAVKNKRIEYILPPLCDVSAGPFLMGDDKLSVSLPFYQIARFPVTAAEYACFVRAWQDEPLDWEEQRQRLDHPVVNVTWDNAVAYADWLSDCSGQSWRLPSEEEWEKAARGSDGRMFPWGNKFDQARCNTGESGISDTIAIGVHPEGRSPYGTEDQAGNVWEWTATLYDNSSDRRVLRGASFANYARRTYMTDRYIGRDRRNIARAAYRYSLEPDKVFDSVGFRLLLRHWHGADA